MKKPHFFIFLLFYSFSFFAQGISFDNLEKNAGQYYGNIEAALLIGKFEMLNYDSAAKKLTYQYMPDNYLEVGNKYCYIWRDANDKAKIISYLTTDHQEYNDWKKALMLKNYKSKPKIDDLTGTREWFYNKKYDIRLSKQQLAAAEKGKKIVAYIITIVKSK
jgi:hypothetical protein